MSRRTFEKQRKSLATVLAEEGVIRSPEVERVMRTVSREMFLSDSVRANAYVDSPLPIGFGQTISAPHMVAMMAEALELRVALVKELKTGGLLVIPVGCAYLCQELTKVRREFGSEVSMQRLHSVAFVPLRDKDGWEA